MSRDGRSDEEALAIAASLLSQGRLVHLVTIVLMALAMAAAMISPSAELIYAAAAALVILGAETYFAARVGLDARIFERMEKQAATGRLDLSAFDQGLLLAGLVTAAAPERDVETRIAGAVRLFKRQAAAAALQGLVLGLVLALQWGLL